MRCEPHVRFCERAAVKFHRATHLVMGFEKEDHARRMVPGQRGVRRPETLAFLGFTLLRWTRNGRFIVKLKTQGARLTRKLKALRQEAWRLMHAPLTL
jgi:hypothetical protein